MNLKGVARSLLHEKTSRGYNHLALEPRRRFLRFLIRVIGFNLLVKLDKVEGLEHVPAEGAAILMINHIAFIDPIAVLHVIPRNIVPMAKVEALDYPIVGIFPRLWEVIPVRREEADRRAIQQATDVLRAGQIILIAPEATRSSQLQRGKEGVAFLGLRSGVPIIPVAIDGSPGFPTIRYSRRWYGEGVHIRFGRPFRFRPDPLRHATGDINRGDINRGDTNRRAQLRQMTDEAMYILAAMLPEKRRGVYNDLTQATQEMIEWL
jgi:1-acyl-sn-glycerol-3-phosphate acyltransferase